MVGAKQGTGQIDRAGFNGVDVVAARIEPVVRISLGILVREEVALGQLHRKRAVVLAGDHLEVGALVGQLGHDGPRDFGRRPVDALERSQVGDESRIRALV